MVHPIAASERNHDTEEENIGAGHLLYIFPCAFGQGLFQTPCHTLQSQPES